MKGIVSSGIPLKKVTYGEAQCCVLNSYTVSCNLFSSFCIGERQTSLTIRINNHRHNSR